MSSDHLPVILHWCDLVSQESSKCTLEEMFDEPCELCATLRIWVLNATKIILRNLFSYHYHSYMKGSDMGLLNCGVFTAQGAARYLNAPCVSKFDPKDPPEGNAAVVRNFLRVYFPRDKEGDPEEMLAKEMWPYVGMAAQNINVCTLSKLHVELLWKKEKRCTHVQLLSHIILSAHLNGALRFNACLATEMYSGAIRHAMVGVLLQFHGAQEERQKAVSDLKKRLA